MAKVRLSALIADIKGKSQGSVFARNSGGLYFRNNPSGGGRDSSRWARLKAKFSNNTSSWRNLSDEEQMSWHNMAINYPTTDAFGEIRYPKGFELFVSINQTLAAADLPTIRVPVMPVEIPSLGNVEIYTADAKLITNDKFLYPAGNYVPNNTTDTVHTILQLPIPSTLDFLISLRFQLPDLLKVSFMSGTKLYLTKSYTSNEDGLDITMVKVGDLIKISTTIRVGSDTWGAVFSCDISLLKNDNAFTCILNPSDNNAFVGIFNKASMDVENATTDLINLGLITIPYSFIPIDDTRRENIGIQHIVIGIGSYNRRTARSVNYGYALVDAYLQFTFDSKFPEFYSYEGFFDLPNNFKIDHVNHTPDFIRWAYDKIYPFMKFNFTIKSDARFQIVLLSTQFRSAGLTGATSKHQIVGRWTLDGVMNFQFGKELIDYTKFMFNNGVLQFKYYMIDTLTGKKTDTFLLQYKSVEPSFIVSTPNECTFDSDCSGWDCCAGGKCYDYSFCSNDEAPQPVTPPQVNAKFKAGANLAETVNKK